MALADWWPAVTAGSALLGALGGAGITQLFTRKREEAAWTRQRSQTLADARAAIYLDLMVYMENESLKLESLVDDTTFAPIPDLSDEDRLNARIRLYADETVSDVLKKYQVCLEDFNEWGRQTQEVDEGKAGAVRYAISQVQEALRKAVTDTGA